jgi:hypothetical protein
MTENPNLARREDEPGGDTHHLVTDATLVKMSSDISVDIMMVVLR